MFLFLISTVATFIFVYEPSSEETSGKEETSDESSEKNRDVNVDHTNIEKQIEQNKEAPSKIKAPQIIQKSYNFV